MQKSSNNNIMDPLYLRKLLINKQLRQETVQTHKTDRAESVNVNESTEINVAKQAENLVREMREEMLHPRRDLKMNYLASMERSSYVKKVMNLPKTLPELLMQLQNEDSIADDMPQMYYQQNKQKQENLKSDIREGVIRNAKESFEETLNKGVNNNQHSELDSESNKPTQPKPNVENKPNTSQPPRHSEPTGEESQTPIQKPNVDNKPNTPQPPRHSEPTGEESQTPIQRPNVENKPNTPQPPRHSEPTGEESQTPIQRPNVNQEVKPDIPQTKPNVEIKPNIPQQKPNVEIKPDTPQQKPNVENKPNTPQPPRHSEANAEESQTPIQRPNVENKPNIPQQKPNVEIKPDTPQQRPNINQEVKPDVPQTRPNVDNKPNMPETPRHSELDSESNKPTQPKPNVENKPNIPQQKPDINQEVKPNIPQQRPNMPVQPNPKPEIRPMYNPDDMLRQYENNELWQPNRDHGARMADDIRPDMPPKPPMNRGQRPEPMPMPKPPMNEGIRPQPPRPQPDTPHPPMEDNIRPNIPNRPPMHEEIKPDMPVRPNTPQPPHQEIPNKEPQRPAPPNQNVENKPNIPQPKPNVEIKPDTPQQRPNVNQEVKPDIPQTKPNMPVQPNPKPEIRPMYSPDDMLHQYENNELWQPNRNHGARMADDIRPNMPPRPPMNEGIRPEPMPQPRPPMNEGIKPEPMPQPKPPMNDGIRPEPMPMPKPPMNEGIRPEPMPQPRPEQPPLEPNRPIPPNEPQQPARPLPPHSNERPIPNPLPPHRPVMPPHHQHPEHVDVKPDLPGFKPDIGLQEYMRYEMLRPQPLQPPPNTSISSEVHRHHHHHKHLPPPEEEINQETQAAMNVMQNVQQPAEPTVTQMRQRLSGDAAELFFTGLINLNDLSNTLKTNSKGAKAKLVLAMANASKHGIDNSQINDTLKMISASMAATETSTPSKVLKNIIELYLPWYPLQQGVGFDLSIETKAGEQDFLSVLKVWIQTRNYGNVNAILTLMTSNSVDMSIQCSEKFPKDDLLKRLNEETKNRTMQSNINVEEFEQTEGYIEPQQQAKVSLSSTYEMNPYLLLMAHSFIKNTIVIDSNMSFS